MDDLLAEFLAETQEGLDILDIELLKLEQNPNDPEIISGIFRIVHTIKGTCGFLGLPRLGTLAHAAENVLGKFRDKELEVNEKAVSLILKTIDQIKGIVVAISQTGSEPEGEDAALIAELDACAAGDLSGGAEAPAAEAAAEAPAASEASASPAAPAAEAAPAEAPAADASASADEQPKVENVAPPKAAAPANVPAAVEKKAPQQTSVRVNVELLEDLMNTVSELVLTRNQLLQIARSNQDSILTASLQRLNHITTELQEGVMKTRMQPIGNAWAKLPRIVRDLALDLDKKINLVMVGEDTELDRQVIELIGDPLTHMVRNSADHGIEMPADRVAAGKPETGTVKLEAFHEGGHIIVKIVDDGKGLSVDKIKEKIIKNGLASAEDLANMSEQQIQMHIFKPGFSTAAQVTSVSGRGVGMDVVKTNIEKIGGTVELNSKEGKGSTFTIKIPLTLAIVSALIVECSGERFAVPQLSVDELVLVSATSEHRLEEVNGIPVLRIRERLLPLISLEKELQLKRSEPEEPEPVVAESEAAEGEEGISPAVIDENVSVGRATRNDEKFIIVSRVGSNMFGIIVDRVFDTEEIVVKPVAPLLRDVSMFSGNTILGDGSVVMILDPNGLASKLGDVHAMEDTESQQQQNELVASNAQKTSLLLFKVGTHPPIAVQLALVARLEDFPLEDIEESNGQLVIQYRGKLMPLISMEDNYQRKQEGRQPAIVFSDGDRSMGLLVDEISDIIDDRITIEVSKEQPGIMGSAIIAGKATEIIDVPHYLTKAFGDWFINSGDLAEGAVEKGSKRLLLVDDSAFFRNLLMPILSVAGYDVITAGSGKEAMDLLEEGHQFAAIVSDIEMPEMNGYELAKNVTTSEKFKDIPIVALSSYTSPKEITKGREAGFADYVPKHDRDALLETLLQTINAEELISHE